MSSNKSPLAVVKDKFGGKDKLVDALVGLLDTEESKDDLRKRLLGVSNTKLLRLHEVTSDVKKRGGREKVLESTVGSLGRAKDKDYVAKLGRLSTKRLYDVATVAERRAKRAQASK
jgi:hypothetical protein